MFIIGSSQLIAHSARVRTPKRHNSESVLYIGDDKLNFSNSSQCGSSDALNKSSSQNFNRSESSSNFRNRSSRNNSRLFPVSTYSETSPTSPGSGDSPK